MKNNYFVYKTIKTFDDACKEQDIDPACLPNVLMLPIKYRKSILAHYKLAIIYEAINDGWQPNWNDVNEYKYWPYFSVEKASGGRSVRFSASGYSYDFTYTSISGRLCTNSEEKAKYIGTQFVDLYEDFFLFPDETMLKIDCFLEQIAPLTPQEKRIEELEMENERLKEMLKEKI